MTLIGSTKHKGEADDQEKQKEEREWKEKGN
jgi:hypothetical protein